MVWRWAPSVVLDRLADRGLEPYEVMQVLDSQQRWPRQAIHDGTGLTPLTIWGRTAAGRALVVALRPLSGRDWEIRGARDLTPAELAELQEWEARRE